MTPPTLAAYTALHAAPAAIWLAEGGAARAITRGEAIRRLADAPVLLLNAPLTGARIGYPDVSGLDLLELFAFVRPARFCVPTAAGLARALQLDPPADEAEAALLLPRAAAVLLAEATTSEWRQRAGAETALSSLVRLKWPWAPLLADVPPAMRGEAPLFAALPEWEDAPLRPRPADIRLDPAQVQGRLRELPADTTFLRKLEVMIETHLTFVLLQGDIASASIQLIWQIPLEIRERTLAVQRAYGATWRQVLEAARDAGEIRSDVNLSAIRMSILGALNWAADWYHPTGAAPKQIARDIVLLVLHGLAAR